MTDFSVLDNPMWHSLNTDHKELALSHGRAARYQPSISPLAGVEDASVEAFADLRQLVSTGGMVVLLRGAPFAGPAGWEVAYDITIDQMVCDRLAPVAQVPLLELGQDDAPAMLELARVTAPGPFEAETYRTGRYMGMRSEDGRLVAMAGERSRPPGFTEISAVCTAPEFRGRGLARSLVSQVARMIEADGRMPFLHLNSDNAAAKRVYEGLGFRFRTLIHLKVLKAV